MVYGSDLRFVVNDGRVCWVYEVVVIGVFVMVGVPKKFSELIKVCNPELTVVVCPMLEIKLDVAV